MVATASRASSLKRVFLSALDLLENNFHVISGRQITVANRLKTCRMKSSFIQSGVTDAAICIC